MASATLLQERPWTSTSVISSIAFTRCSRRSPSWPTLRPRRPRHSSRLARLRHQGRRRYQTCSLGLLTWSSRDEQRRARVPIGAPLHSQSGSLPRRCSGRPAPPHELSRSSVTWSSEIRSWRRSCPQMTVVSTASIVRPSMTHNCATRSVRTSGSFTSLRRGTGISMLHRLQESSWDSRRHRYKTICRGSLRYATSTL